MIDEWRRAGHVGLTPSMLVGLCASVIDLRPAELVPRVVIELADGTALDIGGPVAEDDLRVRHAAADAAVRTVVEDGAFILEAGEEFSFYPYADSADDLRDSIAARWQQTRLAPETHAEAAALLAEHPCAHLWLREQVAIPRLTPPAARLSEAVDNSRRGDR